MTVKLYGMGVSRGIAIGKVHVILSDQVDILEHYIDQSQIESEINRLQQAVEKAKTQLSAVRDQIPETTSADIVGFIDAHLLMLDDAILINEPIRKIREKLYSAEWALKLQRDALVSIFEEMDDSYLRTRKDDIEHVINRILRILLNHSTLAHEKPDNKLEGYVVLADDLTPADTVLMQHNGILAFATEYGGPTSHTAILARSMGIPAIISLRQAVRSVEEDDLIIVDGEKGIFIIDPDEKTLAFYRQEQDKFNNYYASLNNLVDTSASTIDSTTIVLQANIELPRDFESVRKVGAAGVGLYRTEFLYMNRESPPDEEEHFQTYRKVIDILDGLPLTIRTLDLGADKQVDGGRSSGPVQSNPALGLRAIRLCLKEPELFRPQLRAILRVSAHGPVRILIPMLSNVQEIEQVFLMIDEIKAELKTQAIPFDSSVAIGAMIEVPAAAICADIFAEKLAFLSIGTNDLIQYTMAIDRVNDEVNYLYEPLHPAVLRLIKMVLDAGNNANIPVSMCGEMAGDCQFTRLLLSLGLRDFSIHPANLLEVKQIITHSDLRKMANIETELLGAKSGADVSKILENIDNTLH